MSSAFHLSVGSNFLMLGIVAVLIWRDHHAVSTLAPSAVRPTAVHSETPQTNAAHQPKPVGPILNSSDIAQLERMGIPRNILISVLLEDLNRRSTKRVLKLQKRYAPRSVPDHVMRELSRESVVEQIRELKEAFGEDGYLAWDKEQTLHALNRARVPGDELPMTAAEAEQAYRLQKEFDEKNRELQIMMEDGVTDTADTGTLQAQAQQALDRELEKLLGKQRFDELRGNVDPSTEVYRTFGDLNPTPSQAKEVLQAEKDYRAREAALAKSVNENPGDVMKLAAELKMLGDTQDESLRRIFGTAAYDNTKRQNDPTYKTLQQYAGTWQLNTDEIQSVYETLHTFQDQAARTRSAAEMSELAGQRVNWREINATIERSRQQIEASLQNQLGGERLQRLRQNGILTAQ